MEALKSVIAILIITAMFFLLLYKKATRIAVLAVCALLLCMKIVIPLVLKGKGTPVEDELSGETRYEYHYAGNTEEQAIKAMEKFLRWSTGTNAKHFIMEPSGTEWRFVYKNIKTDCVYSYRIDGDKIVICDNTPDARLPKIKRKIEAYFKKYTLEGNSDRLNKECATILSTEDSPQNNVEIRLFYSSREDKYYDFLQYDVVDADHNTIHKEMLIPILEDFETKPEPDYFGTTELPKNH